MNLVAEDYYRTLNVESNAKFSIDDMEEEESLASSCCEYVRGTSESPYIISYSMDLHPSRQTPPKLPPRRPPPRGEQI